MTQNYPNIPPQQQFPQQPSYAPPQTGMPGYPPGASPMLPPPGMPAPKKKSWAAIISVVVTLLIVAAALLAWLGHKSQMGTALKVTEKETVNYSGKATEADAKLLGEELKKMGYFINSSQEKDVLLRKDDEGTTVSFVVGDNWNTPQILAEFTTMGASLAKTFGKPLKMKLIDPKLKELKDIPIN
jgi:hypothetical protein